MRTGHRNRHADLADLQLADPMDSSDSIRARRSCGLAYDLREHLGGHLFIGIVPYPPHRTAVIVISNHTQKEQTRPVLVSADQGQHVSRVDGLPNDGGKRHVIPPQPAVSAPPRHRRSATTSDPCRSS